MNKQAQNQIEKYLDNKLSEAERIAFEQALKQDEILEGQLQQAIEVRKLALEALLQKETSSSRNTIRWTLRLGFVGAAVVVLFL